MERRIKPLEATTVNRIAAGEIIVAPANALKELLENSLDAGCTRVEVVVKEGGLKLLQITDDGHGIHKEDLPLLCQRFATSKIDKYEDLESIDTYGFRGEALASISHVSRLSVVTKTEDSPCAWLATYSDGQLKEVKATAGKTGTQIIVEDLFYNVPSRLRSLKGPNDELTKIVDVAGRYAIHTHVGIGVKKFGESHFALSTRPGLSVKERIRSVFGNAIAAELIPLDIHSMDEYGVVGVTGQLTNPNFNNKKSIQPVFFINNRLVSNDVLRRALNSTMTHFLPKGHKPFVYMSLNIQPRNLDVNVHPTKREVRFLHEDVIIDKICVRVTDELSKIDSSRTFSTQTLLPHNQRKRAIETEEESKVSKIVTQQAEKKRLDYKLVRTDASQAKITTFMRPTEPSQFTQSQQTTINSALETQIFDNNRNADEQEEDQDTPNTTMNTVALPTVSTQVSTQYKYTPIDKAHIDVNLQSILDLRHEVELGTNNKLTEMFANITYIGIVDSERRLCALQYDVKLMLVDYGSILAEFFYQLALEEFSNFGYITLDDGGLDLKEVLQHVYDSGVETSMTIDQVIDQLVEMKEMLGEYFSIKIVQHGDGKTSLVGLPLMLKGYVPSLSKLPIFIYRLATKVNWEDEKECLGGISRQIALLYVPDTIVESFSVDENDSAEDESKQVLAQQRFELNETMENILVPSIKRKFLAPHSNKKDVIEIANLPGLYRVFERC